MELRLGQASLLASRGSRSGQATSGEAPAGLRTAVRSCRAGSAGRRAGIPAGELPRSARRAHARATVGCESAGTAGDPASRDVAVSLAVAQGTVAALRRLLARLAGGLASRGICATEHALGDAPARARATVIVRLATLVLGKTAARPLAAAVAAAVTRTAALRLRATLGNHLAPGQGLAGAGAVGSHLTQSRAAVGGVAAALAGDATPVEQETPRAPLGDRAASAATAIGISRAVLASRAAIGRAGRALAAGTVARAAVARGRASSLFLNAEAAAAGCIARITPEAATSAGARTYQAVAGATRLRGASEASAAVLLAKVRTAVLGTPARSALDCTERMATLASAARARATRVAAATRGTVAQAQGQRGGCQLDVAHASRRARRRRQTQRQKPESDGAKVPLGRRAGRRRCS